MLTMQKDLHISTKSTVQLESGVGSFQAILVAAHMRRQGCQCHILVQKQFVPNLKQLVCTSRAVECM